MKFHNSCGNFVVYSIKLLFPFGWCCSILEAPYDTSAEADLLYSLINKAKFENNRYKKPQRKPKASGQNVDWF